MALSDRTIRTLSCGGSRPVRVADGLGLYVEVHPSGSKLWRQKFRFGGKEKRLALGRFPEVGLAQARQLRDDNRALLRKGIDPALERRKAKAAARVSVENSFAKVADELILKMEKEGRAPSTVRKAQWFRALLKPSIGVIPVDQVDPQTLLAALKTIENAGKLETAKKVRSFSSRVFRYAVATGRAATDPAQPLAGALTSPRARHYAAILEPEKFGALLRAIEKYTGQPSTCYALKIAPHVFLRPGELRLAQWSEINLDEGIWRIPADRMKARKAHAFPLSEQVVAYLRELYQFSGPDGYVFPAFHSRRVPLSENTLNGAFRRMGFGKDEVTAHGLRSTASTLLNESGKFNPDAIERALAHGDSNVVRGAYHRGAYWDERVKMAEWWSSYLCELRGHPNADSEEQRNNS
ncbi:MAG: integrase arm-type DNA-binding domain-containing protein [Pseudomonadota bacterium]